MSKKFSKIAVQIGNDIVQVFAASKITKSQGLEVLVEIVSQLLPEPTDAADGLKSMAARFIKTFHKQGASDAQLAECIKSLLDGMARMDAADLD